MNSKPLVIVGGMGPQASLHLHKLLIEKSLKHHRGDPQDFPLILHASIPVPDFISSPQNVPIAQALIVDVLAKLPIKEAAAVGLACNTAHTMASSLGLDRSNFISMIDAVAKTVRAQNIHTVGLLASPHTIESGLYLTPLQDKGVQVLTPNSEELAVLATLIRSVISGENTESLRPILRKLAQKLVEQGAEAIVLGCTELPLIGVGKLRVPVVDSLSELADGMLHKGYLV